MRKLMIILVLFIGVQSIAKQNKSIKCTAEIVGQFKSAEITLDPASPDWAQESLTIDQYQFNIFRNANFDRSDRIMLNVKDTSEVKEIAGVKFYKGLATSYSLSPAKGSPARLEATSGKDVVILECK